MKKISSVLALLLAAAMVFSLGACTRQEGEKTIDFSNQLEDLEKVRLENVYTVSYIETGNSSDPAEMPVPDPNSGEYSYHDEYIQNIREGGGKIYLTYSYYNEQYINNEYLFDNGIRVYTVDSDGKNLQQIADFKTTSENTDTTSTYVSINAFLPADDGTFWYLLSEESYDWSDPIEYNYETSTSLIHATQDGTELSRFDINELIDDLPEYFYVRDAYLSNEGDIILLRDDRIFVISQDGVLKGDITFSFNANNTWLSSIVRTGSGDFIGLVIDYENNKRSLYRLDIADESFKEIGELPWGDAYEIMGGAGTTVLVNMNSSMYSFDYVTGQQKELINWLNSDINYNRLGNVTPLSDGRFIITEYDRDYSKQRLAFLTRASGDSAVEKYIISYASVYLDSDLQDAIIEYNKQNPEFRIQYLDYSKYNTSENYDGGIKQLNLDIISGKIPDLISLDQLPFQTYASKGLLLDLGAVMDADESFDRADYLENVLTAPRFNGKNYSIIPNFYIMSVVGKTEYVGSEMGWTIDDLSALMESHPDSALFDTMTKSNMLYYFVNMAMDKFIDYDSGTCSFNTDSFMNMLKIVNSFPDYIDWDAYYQNMTDADWQRMDNMYRDGSTLLNIAYVSGYDDIKSQMNNFGGDITYIGFPVPEGTGSVIMPQMELAISSKSKLKAACWDFLKYIISDEYLDSYGYGLPIRRSVLEKRMAEAMDEERYREMYGYDGGYYIDDPYISYWGKPVTQEQADKVNALINSVSSVYRDATDVMAIIEEETGAYFSGQKSVETVADIIQSRVQIYVNENR